MDAPLFTVDQYTAHIKAFRKARGLTQADLGRMLGVKQSRIADIERDPGSISVAQMHKLLAALGAQVVLRDQSGGWAGSGAAVHRKAIASAASASAGSAHRAAKAAASRPAARPTDTPASKVLPGATAAAATKKRGTW